MKAKSQIQYLCKNKEQDINFLLLKDSLNKEIKMKLSEWIKKEKNEAEEVLSKPFKNGHNFALDKLKELLESKGIDIEIPDKREKY